MKCGRSICKKEAPEDRHYCSKICAQLDAGSVEVNNSGSTPEPEQSSTKDAGVSSEGFLPNDDRTESDLRPESEPHSGAKSTISITSRTKPKWLEDQKSDDPDGRQSKGEQRRESASKISEKTMSSTGDDGMSGTDEMQNPIAKRSESAGESGTPATASSRSPTSLGEEISRSTSMIDDCAGHLLAYLKSIGHDCEKNPAMRDYRQVHAIANIGKQIGNLAKVKIDAIKVATELSEYGGTK